MKHRMRSEIETYEVESIIPPIGVYIVSMRTSEFDRYLVDCEVQIIFKWQGRRYVIFDAPREMILKEHTVDDDVKSEL